MATRSSGFVRNDNDWYVEEVHTTERLLGVENFRGPVLDPACGGGNIPTACRNTGLEAHGSDVVDRGFPGVIIRDFLAWDGLWRGDVICNPPYQHSLQFVLRALDRVTGKIAILEKASWLEGVKRHRSLWSRGQLARVWFFSDRIFVPPGGIEMPGNHPSTFYAWFVFDPSHGGPFSGDWMPAPTERPAQKRKKPTKQLPEMVS